MKTANAMETKKETPKIYVADLAAYVNGKLHGTWIDANQDADGIHEEIQEMLAESPEHHADPERGHSASPHGEWAIHDFGAVCRTGWSCRCEGFGSFHSGLFVTEETLFASRVGVVAVYGRYTREILQAFNKIFCSAGWQSGIVFDSYVSGNAFDVAQSADVRELLIEVLRFARSVARSYYQAASDVGKTSEAV